MASKLTDISFFFSNLSTDLVANGNSTSDQSYSPSNFRSLLILSGLLPNSAHLSAAITDHLKHYMSSFVGFIITFFLDNQSGSGR